MTKLFTILFSVSLLIFSSCQTNEDNKSKSANDAKTFRDFSTKYESGTQRLIHSASFRKEHKSGVSLALGSNSNIEVNQQALTKITLSKHHGDGAYYLLEEKVEKPATSFTYHWTKNDDSTVDATVILPAPIEVITTQVSKETGLLFKTKKEANSNDSDCKETIIAFITGSKRGIATQLITNEYGVGQFNPAQLSKIQGDAILTIKRMLTKDIAPAKGSMGGSLQGIYFSRPITVVLDD